MVDHIVQDYTPSEIYKIHENKLINRYLDGYDITEGEIIRLSRLREELEEIFFHYYIEGGNDIYKSNFYIMVCGVLDGIREEWVKRIENNSERNNG